MGLRADFLILFVFFLYPFPLWGQSDFPPRHLTFEVYASDKPTVVFQMFRPILDQAEAFLSQKGQNLKIDLIITPDYQKTIDDVVNGTVDLSRVGPASYVTMKEMQAGINLVATELVNGKKEFNGYIICRKSSAIRNLAHLKGKSFAFGDPLSTLGRYLPQAALVRAGVKSDDLSRVEFLDRHDKVAAAVLNGDYDAGSVKEQTFFKFEHQGEGLRRIAVLKSITKPWIARKGLGKSIVNDLRKFLLQLTDPSLLKNLDESSGFTMATDADYSPIREEMKIASGF